jgi:hypothetical protein
MKEPCEIDLPCAAEMAVEAATAPSRLVVVSNAVRKCVIEKSEKVK